MSATIYWEPAKRERESLYTMAPQSFKESLRAAEISCPGTVGHSALPALRGMSRLFGEAVHKNPYYQLILAIEEHGEIELTMEY
jgi:hypothetical protein